jgi:hypothetical protein
LEEAARRSAPVEVPKENSPPATPSEDLEEAVGVLQELQNVSDNKKKREIEQILARAAPLMAYIKRQPEIQADAQALEPHRQAFTLLVDNVATYQERIESVFAEERFATLHFTPGDIQRAFDHAGSPLSLPREKLVEHLRATILYLAHKDYRTSASLTLLLSLPDYISAGRHMDGCLVLSCARMTTEAPKETNPFLWQMFVHGYQAWTAAKQARLGA